MVKKGQMKIQQMAFMIIGLTLFFILAGLFILIISFSGLKESKALLDEENTLSLVAKLSTYPEFSCENAFGRDKIACVDLDKLMILKTKSSQYEDFFGVSGIEVIKLFPKSDLECTIENYDSCGKITILQSRNLGVDKSNFVSLCRKVKFENTFYDKCELAKLVVRFKG